MTRALLCALALALCAPAHALAGRWAVGASPASFAHVKAQLPRAQILVPGRALVVQGPRPRVRGARYVIRLDGAQRAVSFANTEPLASEQWYIEQIRAWNQWAVPPDLEPVRVAVIDSGIDRGHPEFQGRIVGGKSFVSGPWYRDVDGHGTFVAGIIAADPFNGRGIAGIAFNAELLIAKVVQEGGPASVSLEGEIEAILWAIKAGARVINLSLGGVRDPLDPRLDTYSPPERDAIAYAYQQGVVVVAAVGNGPDSPKTPWNFADYPAALPHVIGVAAMRQSGSVPDYSNRDVMYVDIAAPAHEILSTIPRNLVDTQFGCNGEPYSDCGPTEFRQAIGTSFAAPQVTAAATLLLGQNPKLTPDQVMWLLERSATDVTARNGCPRCAEGRDKYTGWGRLNVQAALKLAKARSRLPVADALEPNDDVGQSAHTFGRPRTIVASLDYWDDPVDVYAIELKQGQSVFAHMSASSPAAKLVLWKPTTVRLDATPPRGSRAARSVRVGKQERIEYVAPVAGRYYLQVRLSEMTWTRPSYRLSVAVPKPALAR